MAYSDIYNSGEYLSKNPDLHTSDSAYKAAQIITLLDKNKLPFQSVAEVGCGSGEVLVQLSHMLPENISFTGMDIAADFVAIAQTKETSRIRFIQRDITHEKGTEVFDLLLLIDVIEHIENYFEFLRAASQLSKYVVFHIPLDMCMWSLFREKMSIESKERVGHIHLFTEDFIKSVIADNGFEMIDQLYTAPRNNPVTFKQKVVEGIRTLLFKINKRFCSKTIGGMSIMVLAKSNSFPGSR